MGVEHILIIILAVIAIVFLMAGLVVVALLIALVMTLRRLAKKAEEATENLSEAALVWGKKVAPAALSGLLAAGFKHWRKSKHGGTKHE